MVVGVATVVLDVPEAFSLKDKRRVVRGVTDRLRARHNVAIAEVGTQDVATMVTLGIACVSNDAGHAHAMLERAVRAIERLRMDAVLADYRIELV